MAKLQLLQYTAAAMNIWDEEGKPKEKKLTPGQAKAKLMKFCAYQERSQHEVRQKLYAYGLYSAEVEEIIVDLIEGNFLNEERFSRAYAGGKFRMKKWGRLKIQQGLKQHRVSAWCMKAAMEEIDEEAYLAVLEEVLHKKWGNLKGKKEFERKQLCARYAQSRGFESDLIWDLIKKMTAGT
jgi:regulatory protein